MKIRGFRVELTAVTRVVREHPLVRDAVVTATPDPADRRLLAGVLAGQGTAVADLHAHAAARLPEYAVPALWAVVDRFPVTGNGKLDASALMAGAARRADPLAGSGRGRSLFCVHAIGGTGERIALTGILDTAPPVCPSPA